MQHEHIQKTTNCVSGNIQDIKLATNATKMDTISSKKYSFQTGHNRTEARMLSSDKTVWRKFIYKLKG